MDTIHRYEEANVSELDRALERAVLRWAGSDDPWVGLAALLVSRSASQGDVCLDLTQTDFMGLGALKSESERQPPISLDEWRHRLTACEAVGAPGDFRPLILDGNRLYLHRFWCYEQAIARQLIERCRHQGSLHSEERLEQALAHLFPQASLKASNGQCQAARMVASRRFTVISGGPGTGKTFTVAKIILLLQMLHTGSPLKIHLAAPTGKAAARLQEAIEAALLSEDRQGIGYAFSPPAAQTLHRLLGYMPGRSQFRYGAGRRLSTDAVIVDEASMIDLSMMHQLVTALPPQARLVLVGDKDQLASVEAGAVLGDICHGVSAETEGQRRRLSLNSGLRADSNETPCMEEHIQVLSRSYRFDAQSGLGALSRAINAGDGRTVLELLSRDASAALRLNPIQTPRALAAAIDAETEAFLSGYFSAQDPFGAFAEINRFRILTALRQGPWGVHNLNLMVEAALRRRGWIPSGPGQASLWYRRRPVMVTRNDYHQGLYNGDIGIVEARFASGAGHAAGRASEQMQVVFASSSGTLRELAPHQVAAHETVYAMTIHKSQGSEFDRVMVVLPDHDSPLLTRELIYTAVTRARRSLVIHADPELLRLAVTRRIERTSGLREALWGRS